MGPFLRELTDLGVSRDHRVAVSGVGQWLSGHLSFPPRLSEASDLGHPSPQKKGNAINTLQFLPEGQRLAQVTLPSLTPSTPLQSLRSHPLPSRASLGHSKLTLCPSFWSFCRTLLNPKRLGCPMPNTGSPPRTCRKLGAPQLPKVPSTSIFSVTSRTRK